MGLRFNFWLHRRDFDLHLHGEFENRLIGIYGPSGAGKTSFFSVLAGLERPGAGQIVLNGRVLTDVENRIAIPPNKRRIGVVFQEKLLFPHMNVKDNLLFGHRYAQKHRIDLETVCDLLDLKPILRSKPAEISGGEQQRTAIGRALLASPELLLMDEPFNAVDRGLRLNILPYLKRLEDQLDIPMLVISHDLSDLRSLTDMVYLIEKGRSPGLGQVRDLFDEEGRFDDSGLVGIFVTNSSRETVPEPMPVESSQSEFRFQIPKKAQSREHRPKKHPVEINLTKTP